MVGNMAISFDPFSPEILANPYPHYQRLRDEAPCYFVKRHQLWVLSRYDDVVAALKNPTIFSSSGGVGPAWKSEPIMSMYDPPEHTRLRRLVAPFFTVGAMEAMGAAIEANVERRMAPLLASGTCELVEELAIPVSLDVMASVLGIQVEGHEQLRRWADATTDQLAGGLEPARAEEAKKDIVEFVAFLRALLKDRRVNPDAPGVIGHLLSAADTDALTAREQVAFCVLLLAAGWGTTAIGIANTILALTEFPDQWALLQAQTELLGNVSEEAIRYDGPIQSFFRNTLADVEFAGVTIPANSKVQILFGSANRDERKFPNPDCFLIERATESHIGYGAGIHTCLGAPLARVAIAAVVRVCMRHVSDFKLAGTVERRPDVIFRTVAKLPLTMQRRDISRGASIPPPTARRARAATRR